MVVLRACSLDPASQTPASLSFRQSKFFWRTACTVSQGPGLWAYVVLKEEMLLRK